MNFHILKSQIYLKEYVQYERDIFRDKGILLNVHMTGIPEHWHRHSDDSVRKEW